MDTSEPQNTAKASPIVSQKIRSQLLQYSSNPAKLREIIGPIFAFEWNRRTIGAFGSGPIDDLVEIAKDSKSPHERIGRLRRILATSYCGESLISPTGWEIWRGSITRFHLWAITPFTAWTKIATTLSTRRIKSPIELTSLAFTETSALDQDCDWGGSYLTLAIAHLFPRRGPH